jgi:hypothetical protein
MTPNLCHPQPSTAPRKRSSLVRDRRSRHYRKEGAAIGALVELTPNPQGSFFWHPARHVRMRDRCAAAQMIENVRTARHRVTRLVRRAPHELVAVGNCTQSWPFSRPNHPSPIHGSINQRLFQPGTAKAFEIVLPVAVPLDGHLISKPSQGDVGLRA